jgi:hypothetical protein
LPLFGHHFQHHRDAVIGVDDIAADEKQQTGFLAQLLLVGPVLKLEETPKSAS